MISWQVRITRQSSSSQFVHLVFGEYFPIVLCAQSGAKLASLVDTTLPLLFSGELVVTAAPQVCCACATLGRWAELHEIKVLLSNVDPVMMRKRYADYQYLARTSAYNLDLQAICEAAERLAPTYVSLAALLLCVARH